MGSLKPGATYIYERADGVTYAREFGSTERVAIGWDYDSKNDLSQYYDAKLWRRVLKEAETNHTLHQAVERVILLYKLSVSKYD
jgi:hypothetical protein